MRTSLLSKTVTVGQHSRLKSSINDGTGSYLQSMINMFFFFFLLLLLFTLSVMSDLCNPIDRDSLSFTISQGLLKFTSMALVMPTDHFILCQPLLLLPSMFRRIKVFSNKLSLHIRWPKYWGLSITISTSNEYSGLTSFRID